MCMYTHIYMHIFTYNFIHLVNSTSHNYQKPLTGFLFFTWLILNIRIFIKGLISKLLVTSIFLLMDLKWITLERRLKGCPTAQKLLAKFLSRYHRLETFLKTDIRNLPILIFIFRDKSCESFVTEITKTV